MLSSDVEQKLHFDRAKRIMYLPESIYLKLIIQLCFFYITSHSVNISIIYFTHFFHTESAEITFHFCCGGFRALTSLYCRSRWSSCTRARFLRTFRTCPPSCWIRSPGRSLPSHTGLGHTLMWCQGHTWCHQSPAAIHVTTWSCFVLFCIFCTCNCVVTDKT